MNQPEESKKGFVAWIKRVGWVAFFFFLLKGIAWLVIGYFGIEFFRGGCN
ncbi:MAG: hypothetical protein KDC12_07040 [Flavobacteriales bacterium]|nr:hypothetical protein [Flavobacteriales bacterium]